MCTSCRCPPEAWPAGAAPQSRHLHHSKLPSPAGAQWASQVQMDEQKHAHMHANKHARAHLLVAGPGRSPVSIPQLTADEHLQQHCVAKGGGVCVVGLLDMERAG